MVRPENPWERLPKLILFQAVIPYAAGVTLSGFYNFITQSYNSRMNSRMRLKESFIFGTQAARMHAPQSGRYLAGTCFMLSSLEYSIGYMREKDDSWNGILAGFATGGLLGMRCGPREAAIQALTWGIAVAIVEGTCAMLEDSSD